MLYIYGGQLATNLLDYGICSMFLIMPRLIHDSTYCRWSCAGLEEL